jgi:hypothetical protein
MRISPFACPCGKLPVMRFSLKWLLAVMAYVALAAVSVRNGQYYAHALSAINFLAIVSALIWSVLSHGKPRAVAIGFAIASVSYLACQEFTQESVPSFRIAQDLYPPQLSQERVDPTTGVLISTPGDRAFARARAAFDSLGTMLTGLVGAMLGAVATRQKRVVAPTTWDISETTLIRDGRILWRNLSREWVTKDALMAALWEQGIHDVSAVRSACVEADGRISIVKIDQTPHR